MLNAALIIGSTRPNRFADVPARWIESGARARQGRYTEPAAEAWRLKIGTYDAEDLRGTAIELHNALKIARLAATGE
jgi:hypothetical protein